jgi:hypothetical protein
MVTQDPNPAQVNGSSTLVAPSPNSTSSSSFGEGGDSLSIAIHNAILLGWSIMELKSRVQITASNLMLDSIIFNQQDSSFVANITGPLPNDGIANMQPPPATGTGDQQAQPAAETGEVQPDVIDALLKNVILNDIESLVQQYSATSTKALSTKGQSLSTELRDNIWLTSTMRENFRRIVTLHLQRFPDSDTTDTIYDINPPFPSDTPDYEDTDFPYLYLYPGKFDYANVGVSCLWKPGTPENDRITPFVKRFKLCEVTRRAVNCLTLLLSSPDEALDPAMIACFQKKLVPRVMGSPSLTTAFADEQIDDDQSVLVEPACEDLPAPSDSQTKESIKILSSLVIRLLDGWDSFLRESFYVNIDSANNEIELIAYQAGRSLAALTWGVSVALVPLETSIQLTADQQGNSDILAKLTKKVRDTWVNVFNERDINSLQMQISALSKALDRLSTNSTITNSTNTNLFTPGQAVQAVNASLEYWQRAVTQMCLPASDSKTVKPLLTPNAAAAHSAQPPQSSQSHQPQTDVAEPLLPLHWGSSSKALRLALVKQSEAWRTLLLGQRDLHSFTTGKVTQTILNDFMQELEHASSVEFQRVRKRGLNSFWIVIIVAVFVLLLVLLALFIPQIRELNSGQITNPLTLIVLLWGGAAAFVSSVMGRLGDALSRFGPAGTSVAQAFEQGYERVQLEFDYLNHNIAVTYPLIEYFALADFTVLVEQPNGGTAETAIKDGYTFLAYVCWTDDDRKNEIKEVARAAFGPIGAFVGAELKSEQNPKGSKTPGGTLTGKVITRPKPLADS